VDRSSAEGALVEAPKASRGVRCGERCSPPEGRGLGDRPLPGIFFII